MLWTEIVFVKAFFMAKWPGSFAKFRKLLEEMSARISFMSAEVATAPTSGWQALASGLASDSAPLISRLIITK